MKILYIGDVMAELGMRAVEQKLPALIKQESIDFVVAQAENVSSGKSMTVADYERLKAAGVQAFTGGNHTPSREELTPLLEDAGVPVVGPANLPGCPGPGYKLVATSKGSILIISLLGGIVGRHADIEIDNPLKTFDGIISKQELSDRVATVVNLHGDFSSEKVVFGHYADGRVSVVVGDHWHVPTADAAVLPRGSAYVSDVGMCGSLDSSLGVTYDSIIPRWRDGYQTRNELETDGRIQFNALLVEVNEATNKAVSARHIREVWEQDDGTK